MIKLDVGNGWKQGTDWAGLLGGDPRTYRAGEELKVQAKRRTGIKQGPTKKSHKVAQ